MGVDLTTTIPSTVVGATKAAAEEMQGLVRRGQL